MTAHSEVPFLCYFIHFLIFHTSVVHVALQLCFPETPFIFLQILVQSLPGHPKHCSDLCAMVYTSATGIYSKVESFVISHLMRELEIL